MTTTETRVDRLSRINGLLRTLLAKRDGQINTLKNALHVRLEQYKQVLEDRKVDQERIETLSKRLTTAREEARSYIPPAPLIEYPRLDLAPIAAYHIVGAKTEEGTHRCIRCGVVLPEQFRSPGEMVPAYRWRRSIAYLDAVGCCRKVE